MSVPAAFTLLLFSHADATSCGVELKIVDWRISFFGGGGYFLKRITMALFYVMQKGRNIFERNPPKKKKEKKEKGTGRETRALSRIEVVISHEPTWKVWYDIEEGPLFNDFLSTIPLLVQEANILMKSNYLVAYGRI